VSGPELTTLNHELSRVLALWLVIVKDVLVFRILIRDIPHVLSIRHVQRTFGAFYATEIIAKFGWSRAVWAFNLHLITLDM
jgi:hypothetical protein